MNKESYQPPYTIRVYHGYGHQHNLVVYGHVIDYKPMRPSLYTDNLLQNAIHLIRQFFVKPMPNVQVKMRWNEQEFFSITEKDGFFRFEWESNESTPAGWHQVVVDSIDEEGNVTATGEGKIFVPHATQYGIISDIDDTVLVSHSAKTGKKLRVMFTKNPRSRKAFDNVVRFYQLLSLAKTTPDILNPFFYVSSSEWNLYDDLNEFFKHNGLPKGAFLLNSIKKWYQLFKTGTTKHQGKFIRAIRIMEAFPKQKFILLGDNSQQDPEIYKTIANKYQDRIIAVYIRNVEKNKEQNTLNLLDSIENKQIYALQFNHTQEAINHAKSIGLIENVDLDGN
jgi:phosphatidate phosphatase APP1